MLSPLNIRCWLGNSTCFSCLCSSVTSTTLVKSLENTKKANPEVREELCHFAAVLSEGKVETAPGSRWCRYHSPVNCVSVLVMSRRIQCLAQSNGSGNLHHCNESLGEWVAWGGQGQSSSPVHPWRALGKSQFKPSSATSLSLSFLISKMSLRTNIFAPL